MSSTHTSFTGSIPENYDRYLGPLLFEFSAADMARRVSEALDGPTKLLEVACGTGISTRHLAGALPQGSEILATDLNQAMLDHARRVNGDLPGVSYAEADALDLDHDDDLFDAVVCQFGIMFFPDKVQGLREMGRVLKPGGVLAVNVWGSFDDNPVIPVVDQVVKGFFETDPPRFLEMPFSLHDVDTVLGFFAEAGLPTAQVARVEEHVAVTDHALTARGCITGNPTILEIEKHSSASPEEIIRATATALEEAFGPAPTTIPFREIVYMVRKPGG